MTGFEDSAAMSFLSRYGYFALTAGALLEGESVVLIAGFLAHQGYLDLRLVMLCAFIGSSLSDQGLFFLSRFKGPVILAHFPKIEARAQALSGRMSSRPAALNAFAFFFRFIYGIRNIAPVFLGMSGLPTVRYVLLNITGAALWAVCVSSLGFIFASGLEKLLGSLAHYEALVVGILAALAVLFMLWKKLRKRGLSRLQTEKTGTNAHDDGNMEKLADKIDPRNR